MNGDILGCFLTRQRCDNVWSPHLEGLYYVTPSKNSVCLRWGEGRYPGIPRDEWALFHGPPQVRCIPPLGERGYNSQPPDTQTVAGNGALTYTCMDPSAYAGTSARKFHEVSHSSRVL